MKKLATTMMLSMSLLLAACSGSTQSPAAEEKSATTIKVYTAYKGEPGEPLMKIIDAYNAQGKNVKVEHVALVQNNDSREMLQKFDVLAASGEQVDVLFLNNEGFVTERAGNGVLYPLDEFYSANQIDPEKDFYRNPVYNGKHYGMMANASFWYVAMNETHLKEAGLQLPSPDWTWDDFREYAKKLKMSKEGRYGAYFHTFGEYANIIAYTDFKNPQLKEDGSLQFDDPSFEYWFKLRKAMELEDKSVRPHADVLSAKQHWATDFMNGTTSMLPIPMYSLDEAFLNKESYPRDFKITFAPLPRSSSKVEPGLTNIAGSFFTIHKNSKNKEAAFDFIKFATTEGASLGGWIPGWTKADGKAVLDKTIQGKTDLVNSDALNKAIFNDKVRTAGASVISVPYQQQLKKVAEAGLNKYLLDKTSYEDARKFMMEEGKKIIDQNKK
ncbi:ABC transporter substrate-binding protein [Paenibacillus sp. y28]|uniref:ABC transporter substrate-binding protein n=1 Tax=Paenibacillus sp. y28 TaxID=3129110 RepID=UPI0030189ABE